MFNPLVLGHSIISLFSISDKPWTMAASAEPSYVLYLHPSQGRLNLGDGARVVYLEDRNPSAPIYIPKSTKHWHGPTFRHNVSIFVLYVVLYQ